jgi:hypothetical protein
MDAESHGGLGGGEETSARVPLVQQRAQLLTRVWVRTQLAEKRQDEGVRDPALSGGRLRRSSNALGVHPCADAGRGQHARGGTGCLT